VPKHDDANTADRLRNLAIWAEIIASIAVVVSLMFVGLQIRQSVAETALNTRAAEASSFVSKCWGTHWVCPFGLR